MGSDDHGMVTVERFNGMCFQWKKKYLMEQRKCCELCGSQRGLELHHIIPKSLGGTDELENLILICRKCHSLLTPRSILSNPKNKYKAFRGWINREELYTVLNWIAAIEHCSFDWQDILDAISYLSVDRPGGERIDKPESPGWDFEAIEKAIRKTGFTIYRDIDSDAEATYVQKGSSERRGNGTEIGVRTAARQTRSSGIISFR